MHDVYQWYPLHSHKRGPEAYISKPDEWFLKMMEPPAEGVMVLWGFLDGICPGFIKKCEKVVFVDEQTWHVDFVGKCVRM